MKRAYKRWSKEEVLRMIHELDAKGVPLNSGYIARNHPALSYAGRKYVGSWEDAVKAAGLDYERIRRKSFWSRPRIVARIRELRAAKAPLHVSAAETKYGGLVGAASVYFGSWRKAITAAGLDYAQIKRQKEWSPKEIVAEIKRMRREGLRLDTTIPVREKYRTLHAAAIRYFGSWAAALKAAKLERLLKH
jgi:5,10-methylene-tetrahydrofolate dehydrogenase/methenyl tetrahydrofolate cyclohydrolase